MSITLMAYRFQVVLMVFWASSAMAEVGEMMYWTSKRGIARNGSEWIVEADLRRPGSIAIDEIREVIYWTHRQWVYTDPPMIYRSNLDGSHLEVFSRVDGSGLVHIGIDSWDRKIYYTGKIDGGDYTDSSFGGFDLDTWKNETQPYGVRIAWDPYGAVVDPLKKKLYFMDAYGLMSLDIEYIGYTTDGSSVPESLEGPLEVYPLEDMKGYRDRGRRKGIFDLEMDVDNGVIYWSGENGIGKSRLADGKEGISLFMEVPARQIAVDPSHEDFYWAKDGEIYRSTFEGSSSELVIDISGFRDEMSGYDMSGYDISNIVDMAAYKGRIYWSDLAGTLHSCDRDGKDLRALFAPVVRRPSGIFADSERGRILWGDRLSGSVFEADLDGSEMRIITSESLDVSDVLSTGDRLYWCDNAKGEIWSSNLDGSGAEPVIRPGTSLPTLGNWPPMTIAYDSVGERVCWQGEEIYCADPDGSNVDLLVSGGGSVFYDIAVDGQQASIYWSDQKGLYRMLLGGGGKETLYRAPYQHGFSVWDRIPIALSLDQVYWFTWDWHPLAYGPWVDLHWMDKDDKSARFTRERLHRGQSKEHPESIAFYLPAGTAVHHLSEPSESALHRNYPNPFNGETRIPYTVSRDGPVSLTIYNALGQPVASLADGMHSRGAYEAVWDTEGHESLASGIYPARLVAGDVVRMRKLTLLR
ncbi:MAG: T9SS type A sorting domain-containing protein [Gemmatimonadaceae bacterium]|nr:T9SS type A sorting domain-containing protein [Gemmatimonadaceae bacterium]